MNGVERIAAERRRQIEQEGWTAEHDAQHIHGELVEAAVAYAFHGASRSAVFAQDIPHCGDGMFPRTWDISWWKKAKKNPCDMTKEDRIRHLEKAGALLAAEIDRLQADETHE